MRDRRDHQIIACASSGANSQPDFSQIASRSQVMLERKTLVADTPPPERDIVLTIVISDQFNGLTGRSLKRTFGLAFDINLVVASDGIRMSFEKVLDGIVGRMARDNDLISHYGIHVIIYAGEISDAMQGNLYAHFRKWCRRIGRELKLEVTHNVVCSDEEFRYTLGNEHRRMVFGDVEAQFAASKMRA